VFKFEITLQLIKGLRYLVAAIAKLKRQIKILETEIVTIKESNTFKTIIEIEDWDDYFSITKEKLLRELEELQLEVKARHYGDRKKKGL